MPADQFELSEPPYDSISCVKFSPTHPDRLLVAAWDATVRYYDTAKNEQMTKFDHRAAVLVCCFSSTDPNVGFSGGLDASVRLLDFQTEKIANLGQHSDSISCMNYSKQLNSLITGSWDRTIRFWDSRLSTSSTQHLTATHSVPERVYYMDLIDNSNTLVVAMASRLFHIYDVRSMNVPVQERESSLKFMTRSLACMADGQGYASASTEGRIAIEYFDPSSAVQDRKYAFKCHRQTIDDVDHVWPVNALAFHPVYNTFASAGSDGTVSIWDHKFQKRLRQYPRYSGPIPSIAFNGDGSRLAVGVSYTWDDGDEGARTAERPALYVRKIGNEAKPKDDKRMDETS